MTHIIGSIDILPLALPHAGGPIVALDEEAGEVAHAFATLERSDSAAATAVRDLLDVLLALRELNQTDADWLFWFMLGAITEHIDNARAQIRRVEAEQLERLRDFEAERLDLLRDGAAGIDGGGL